ncbi:MAG: sigma-54 dependent transcriptional regulator [Nitrospirota bacterium]|nr:sigma-54 dependent transcriptional regulator [Nitrospirota bacterium]
MTKKADAQQPKVLIVEDEKVTRTAISGLLRKEGMRVFEAVNGREAIGLFLQDPPDAVILDLEMPVLGGRETIGRLKELDENLPVIIVTAHTDAEIAVELMKLGAYHYLVKPVEPGKLIITLQRALEFRRQTGELSRLRTAENASLERFIGRSPSMRKVVDQLKQVAATDLAVVIQGETGTGKTLLAKILHNSSRRVAREFVKIDLGSMPESIIESELFGSERGAFTGAVQSQRGFFEAANGGTAFLDDLENVSPLVQSKLLTVLESKTVSRLGSRKTVNLDIRIIAATNTDLQKQVREGTFREDLFFRIGEFIITLPPLRDRIDDIPFFAGRLLEAAREELNLRPISISGAAMERLMRYSWPGNLRELKNVIRRAALLSGGSDILPEHVEFLLGRDAPEIDAGLVPLRTAVGAVEKRMISLALETTKGNKAAAAAILQVDVKTLRTKMREHGIETD